jgi:DNA polymerase-3 subunit alpha
MAGTSGWQGPGFVHLRVHSSYSLLEGALAIGRLDQARQGRRPHAGAGAVTDTNNLFGVLEFSEKMKGESGIQPIVGVTLGCRVRRPAADPKRPRAGGGPASRCSHAARRATATSWRSPRAPSWRAPTSASQRPDRRARRSPWRRAHRADRRPRRAGRPGLPRQPGRAGARPPRPARIDLRRPALCRAAAPRHSRRAAVEPDLIEEAYERGLPLVATNECYFASLADYESHDALICHRGGAPARRFRAPPAHARAPSRRAPRWRRSSPTCRRR